MKGFWLELIGSSFKQLLTLYIYYTLTFNTRVFIRGHDKEKYMGVARHFGKLSQSFNKGTSKGFLPSKNETFFFA